MPTRNRVSLVERAVDNVINQTFDDWELIVLDVSTDNSVATMLDDKADDRIRCLRDFEPESFHETRRKWGIEMEAKGTLIAPLNSDDYWSPNRLQKHVDIWRQNPNLGLSWDWWFDTGLNTKSLQPCRIGLNRPSDIIRYLWRQNFIFMSSMVFPKHLVDLLGYPGYYWAPDWILAILISRNYPCYFIGETLSFYDTVASGRLYPLNSEACHKEEEQIRQWIFQRNPMLVSAERVKWFLTHGRKARLLKHVVFW